MGSSSRHDYGNYFIIHDDNAAHHLMASHFIRGHRNIPNQCRQPSPQTYSPASSSGGDEADDTSAAWLILKCHRNRQHRLLCHSAVNSHKVDEIFRLNRYRRNHRYSMVKLIHFKYFAFMKCSSLIYLFSRRSKKFYFTECMSISNCIACPGRRVSIAAIRPSRCIASTDGRSHGGCRRLRYYDA